MIGIFSSSSFLIDDLTSALAQNGLQSYSLYSPACPSGGLLSKAGHVAQADSLCQFLEQYDITLLYIDSHLAIPFFSVISKKKIKSVGLIEARDTLLAEELLRRGMYKFLFLPFYDDEIG